MKIRSTKSEARNKFEIRIFKSLKQSLPTFASCLGFRSSGFVSDFGFRISDFFGACVVLCLVVATSVCASDLKKDEELIFFPVIGQKVDKGAAWEAEIHGWVYEPERRTVELELFRASLGVKREEASE